ncbi:hypothetical protein SEVIR_3G115700v4 [Setaria viridis]|uniref:BHLH domain-containing protein n=4 Tax=Setaria TaxID=4554 RepID=A0A368QEH9_SETIT|nr:hypothetical protein SETIT_3G113200v2 [Setaria italica]TKW25378.1 hypothetical protein SEVIR_3G115700v2 [Setaria viridis]
MDGCGSWPALQGGGIGHGDAASELSCGSKLQDLPISYQVEEQLQQIYLLMGMEEHGRHAEAPSSAFRSFSGSPDEASSLMPGSSTISRRHTPEVSSLKDIPLSPVTFGDHHHYGHSYGNLDDTIQNMEQFRCQESHQEHAQRKNSHCGGAGAFMPYSRHLTTKKQPKPPGSGGQRAIKASMSALARMHMVRLAQWRHCRQMEMAVAPPARSNNCSQLQHVLSERKRREKLNDSFKALTTVLPPSPKKDKASILIRARDYLNTLKSRVSELEERNRMLVELQRHCNNGVDRDFVSGEEIEVNIDRATTEEISQELHLKIVVRSGCNSMDAVVGILECLKEIGDVRITAMDTGNRASEPPP